jgi:nicotinate-nucleotide adenylyltransferase
MQIAIYGGSFNPPHLGHVDAARAAVRQLRPERLLLVPAAVPPHKKLEPDSPDAGERLRLVQLMAQELPEAEASDIELCRGGKSYTADTIEQLRSLWPEAEFVLLMGTDMFLSFENWYRATWLMEQVTLGVFLRADGQRGVIAAHAERLKKTYGASVVYIDKEPMEVSSTEIRKRLAARGGRELLPAAVYARIIQRRLYGAKPEFGWLRERAYEMLDSRRVPHVQGCESEAVRLAQRWGADLNDAREAAILHDITKKLKPNEQLLLCEKYGMVNDTVEMENPKLLHAKTGAAVARDVFGVSEPVYDAIFWHTTGRPEMTLLEKVIYMADYIEPTRTFDGVDTLRRLAYTDMDEAMRLGLEMSLEEIARNGAVAHGRTLEALEWFSNRRER